MILVVVVVAIVLLEEEPLRSDTRLPLESSPYIAGNFYTVNWQPAKLVFLFHTVASDILPMPGNVLEVELVFGVGQVH